MLKIILAIGLIYLASPADAAPIWLERQAIPESKVIDLQYLRSDEQSTIRLDHTLWSEFLDAFTVAGDDGVNRVRYAAATTEDRDRLRGYVRGFEVLDVATLTKQEQAAFWINLYNAATVLLILENPGVSSIRKIDKAWDRPSVVVGGRSLSLGAIEHGIVRPAFADPRMHYALNCASLGCPNLARAAYSSDDLDGRLDAGTRAYVNHPRGVRVENGRVIASKIFGWYASDFGPDGEAVLDHIRRYADPPLAAALKGMRKIDAYEYDWALNAEP